MKAKIIALTALLAFIIAGCKPSEKNYRAAYDAAKAKREAARAEAMVPATGLMSDDGPMLKMVEGDSVFVSRDRLRIDPKAPAESRPQPFCVGVGVYKMHTNAEAAASDLKAKGYNATAMQTTGDRWYVIAAGFPALAEARAFIAEFRKKNPKYPYIGLPGAPVVIGR